MKELISNFSKLKLIEASVETNDLSVFFTTIKSHKLNIQCNSTDNFLEDNTAINDTIAINPLRLTISGKVGEIYYKKPDLLNVLKGKLPEQLQGLVGSAANKLNILPLLLPSVGNYTTQAKNTLNTVQLTYERYMKILNKARLLWNNDTDKGTQQAKTAQELTTAIQAKKLFIVDTPWGKFENMLIEDFELVQDESFVITDMTISLKQLNFVDALETTRADEKVIADYLQSEKQQENNLGIAPTKGISFDWNKSIAKNLVGYISGIFGK